MEAGRMDSKKLKDILKQHKMWLTGKEGGKCADLRGANLRSTDLCDADLCGANLRGADLCNADLCDADLCNADLRGANLRDANLRDARNIELAQNLFDPICCPVKAAKCPTPARFQWSPKLPPRKPTTLAVLWPWEKIMAILSPSKTFFPFLSVRPVYWQTVEGSTLYFPPLSSGSTGGTWIYHGEQSPT
jgi:hypothetical protein